MVWLRISVLIAVLFTAITLSARISAATPVAAQCAVAPMPDDQYAALLATPVPVATPEPFPYPPRGDPVDDQTQAEVLTTLTLFEFCAASGNLQQLATLTTPALFVRSAFASEPEPILPATPGSEPPGNAPADSNGQLTLTILDARLQTDGSVAAVVDPGDGHLLQVRLVAQEDSWLVDDIQPVPGLAASPTAEADVSGIGTLVDAIITDATTNQGVEFGDIVVAQVESVEWPDAALGCPVEGGVYAAVITPGYRIVLSTLDGELQYHTDLNGNFVYCDVSA